MLTLAVSFSPECTLTYWFHYIVVHCIKTPAFSCIINYLNGIKSVFF
uniref:Uncharacterized protein n=1 Tax=Rhizophora mucronata TaxID=61149 RepID=A0A2P2NJB9_RHIMU